jgi:hypothetical protein
VDRYLKENEVAVLVISPDHEVRFAGNIEVVYVVPPILDTINRWMRDTPIDSTAPPPMDPAPEEVPPGRAKK